MLALFASLALAVDAARVGVFAAMDAALFYVFWEVSLVPMYFLIGIWGHERRIYAAVKFFLFTMAGSVLMLGAIRHGAPPGGRSIADEKRSAA